MTPFAYAVLGAVFGIGGAAVAVVVWLWPVPRTAPAAPAPSPGLVPAAFRYCPAELRTRAAVPHPDGTATCDGCGTHIPAGDPS